LCLSPAIVARIFGETTLFSRCYTFNTLKLLQPFVAGLPNSSFSGPDSTVLGPDSTVLGPDSTVLGPDSTVLGPDSTVLGPGSTVLCRGQYCTRARVLKCAEDRTVLGPDSTVLGPDSTVLGPDSTVLTRTRQYCTVQRTVLLAHNQSCGSATFRCCLRSGFDIQFLMPIRIGIRILRYRSKTALNSIN
jgi:hypothetical protein